MTRYDVYALGNALVDMEFETTDHELGALEIEKGVMTLVEAERQADLLQRLGRPPVKRASGGSAANTLIAVAQLGGASFYSCKVADDELGRFYANDLDGNGVSSRLKPVPNADAGTGQCMVFVTPDAERSMLTYLGITSDVTDAELDREALTSSSFLYIEGYLVSSDVARATAIEARKVAEAAGVRTSMTLSDPNMVAFFGDGLREMLGDGVELLFCNDSEAKQFAGVEDVRDAVPTLQKVAKTFAVTMGKEGSLIFDGKELTQVPTETVTPRDTNGAGDMFAGAFLYGLTHGMTHVESARLANAAAARLILEFGPRLPADVTRGVLASHVKA